MSLIVTGDDGAAAIIAVSPGLGAEAAARLRLVAADLLAMLGMRLTEFTLNGRVLKSTLSELIGASDGYERR